MTNLLLDCFGLGCAWRLNLSALHPDIHVGDRVFRVLAKLGEGGYATVYLAKELPSPIRPLVENCKYAIKKALANTEDTLKLIQSEVDTLHELQHPNLLRLIDSDISANSSSGSLFYEAYMLFPAYEDGTLASELDRLTREGTCLPTRVVLNIFHQLCLGVQHMHSRGYVHRDIKPHNVLIVKPRPGKSTSCVDQDVESATEANSYHAILMDFGSSKRTPITITNRMAALTLQEDAEAHCTATYRAPELFDVPSSCTLDGRLDVWALGCTLYHIMYGASPFQKAIDKGGTLALAVMQCAVPFPEDPAAGYPEGLHALVMGCLEMDLEKRPQVEEVIRDIHKLQAQGLPDPKNVCRMPSAPVTISKSP